MMHYIKKSITVIKKPLLNGLYLSANSTIIQDRKEFIFIGASLYQNTLIDPEDCVFYLMSITETQLSSTINLSITDQAVGRAYQVTTLSDANDNIRNEFCNNGLAIYANGTVSSNTFTLTVAVIFV